MMKKSWMVCPVRSDEGYWHNVKQCNLLRLANEEEYESVEENDEIEVLVMGKRIRVSSWYLYENALRNVSIILSKPLSTGPTILTSVTENLLKTEMRLFCTGKIAVGIFGTFSMI